MLAGYLILMVFTIFRLILFGVHHTGIKQKHYLHFLDAQKEVDGVGMIIEIPEKKKSLGAEIDLVLFLEELAVHDKFAIPNAMILGYLGMFIEAMYQAFSDSGSVQILEVRYVLGNNGRSVVTSI